MFGNSKKYSCCFCSDLKKTSKNKINFCRDCLLIRDHIRDKGLNSILSIIKNKDTIIPTAPPYK
jgi:hypothetical protein